MWGRFIGLGGFVVVVRKACGLIQVSILRICDIGCQLRGDVCKKKILVQLFDLTATFLRSGDIFEGRDRSDTFLIPKMLNFERASDFIFSW